MKKSSLWLAVLSAIAIQSTLSATSVLASETANKIQTRTLLNKADLVFSGKVVDIQFKDSTDGTPFTFVTYQVDDVIAGRADGNQVTLRFMGGRQQKGDVIRYLSVSETPEFQQGDTDVLFVQKNTTSTCPLVDCVDGRFRNRDGILTSDDGRALIEAGEGDSYALSAQMIKTDTAQIQGVGVGKTVDRREIVNAKVTSTNANLVQTEVVKLEEFVNDLKVQVKGITRFNDGSITFKSAFIKENFRGPALTPVAPRESAPALLRRATTISDFDRWEEEAVRKNNGNPVIQ